MPTQKSANAALFLLIPGLVLTAAFAYLGVRWSHYSREPANDTSAVVKPVQIFDFGVVLPGAQLQHTFLLNNDSGDEISFSGVRTSCGCTGGQVYPKHVPSGGRATLTLDVSARTYTTRMEVTATAQGRLRWKTIEFPVKIILAPSDLAIVGSPSSYIDLGECLAGSSATKTLSITRGPYPAKWDLITCTSPIKDINAGISRKGEGLWELDLKWHAADAIGSLGAQLNFQFWDQGKKIPYEISRRARLRVVGDVHVSPESLLIGVVQLGETTDCEITLTNDAIRDLSVEDVSFSAPEKWTLSGVAKSKGGCVVKVRYCSRQSGQDAGTLYLTIRSGSKQRIAEVGYLALVTSGQESLNGPTTAMHH